MVQHITQLRQEYVGSAFFFFYQTENIIFFFSVLKLWCLHIKEKRQEKRNEEKNWITEKRNRKLNMTIFVPHYVYHKNKEVDTAANVFQTNFWKSHFCALGSRPPLLHLDNSRHSVWRCTLVCHPNNCCKWVKVSWFSSRLHGTNCKVFRVWIFNPWRYSVMNGFWVI